MKIMYWSDYACPYCYIGETYLKQAIRNLGMEDQIEVEMKAFELDPDASREYTGRTVDRFAKKYALSLQEAQSRIDGISLMGRNAGLEFNYAETRYTNTVDAHRLTKLAQQSEDKGQADRLSERLYKAYFAEGLELSNHNVLLRIAREEGMDEGSVKSLLAGDAYAMEVRQDERDAARLGVMGVPHFVLNGQMVIPGALPPEQMQRVICEAVEAEQRSQAYGMTCGPDGCRIAGHQA